MSRHRSFEQGDHRLHELEVAGFRIVADNHGAELISVARLKSDGTWEGYLYRDGEVAPPTDGWKSHATVMGYYIHRLLNQRSFYEGDEVRGGNHSFLRTKLFADPEILEGDRPGLRFQLPSSAIHPSEYPRKVSFQLDYVLDKDCLEVAFHFANEERTKPAHVSFGLHPGFAVSSLEQARIILPRGAYRRYLAPGNFLSGETLEFEADGGTAPFKPFDFPDSFLLEPVDVVHQVVRLQDFGWQRQIEIDLSEAPFFTIWSDLHPFICIEPCWGLPDHHEQEPFEKKLGMQIVSPGETLTRRCNFRFA
jgi:galactose mutarotase-like enzyme